MITDFNEPFDYPKLAKQVKETADRIHDDSKCDISETVLRVAIDAAHDNGIPLAPSHEWKRFARFINMAYDWL